MGNYLAFDLGAESCRAVLGNLDDSKKLQIKLLHRSSNAMINVRGTSSLGHSRHVPRDVDGHQRLCRTVRR